jgi:LEA14-like dessication related protein
MKRPRPFLLIEAKAWRCAPLAFIGLILTLSLGGCAYFRELIGLGAQQPKVHLVDAAVTGFSLTGISLLVTLSVENPNEFDLSFAKLRYKMSVGNSVVASGVLADHVTIPAEGHQQVKLPLDVEGQNVLQLVHDVLTKSNETIAVLNATADFDTPFGPMEVGFEDRRPLHKLAGL